MAELYPVQADVLICCGEPQALDALPHSPHTADRVAPDELLLLGNDLNADEVVQQLMTRDPNCLVLDVSDGYALWAIEGAGHKAAFGRLSAVPLPDAPAIVHGLVAQVPATAIVKDTRIVIVVSSAVSAHLHGRIAGACAELLEATYDEARPLHETEGRVPA